MTDDEISVALLMGTEMSPERFELLSESHWVRAIQARTGQKDLFVYRHRKTGKFGLAQWTVKPKVFGQGVAACVEICLFPAPPDDNPADLPDFDWVCWRCQPGHVIHDEEQKKRMEAMSAKHRALLDRKTMLDDMEKVLRKRKLDEAADKLSLEDVPDQDEELDQMRELLTWAMNDRIISTG